MRFLFAGLVSLILVGCTDSKQALDETVSPDATVQTSPEINWFEGSVEEAFVAAKNSQKPVFLYWGAVWCPPCQEIRNTVFKTQEFINLSRLFVPVYLDGDTERAQAWGDEFGVRGYPTMIVFNPKGDEVTRLPGGIEVAKYNEVLGLSLNQMRSTAELVQLAFTDPTQLSHADLKQLAYYSWGQDTAALSGDADAVSFFYTLNEAASKQPKLQARFYMQYLVELLAAADDESVLVPMDGDNPTSRLQEILASDELTLAAWYEMTYETKSVLESGLIEESARKDLAKLWQSSTFKLRHDDSLSKSYKLAGWFPTLYLETLNDRQLSEELTRELLNEMKVVDADTPDAYERQSVINQIGHVYRRANMLEEAETMLKKELKRSASPYYFMRSLAGIAEQQEDFAAAVDWRRQAYVDAEGEATRFEWGAGYVQAMIRMTPEDAQIDAVAVGLINEFSDSSELFAGRNFRVLRGLHGALDEWREASDKGELAFTQLIGSLCSQQIANSLELSNCQSLATTEPALVTAG